MLKITKSGECLRLEGRVAGPWVSEVRKAVEEERPLGRALTLDLSGVTYVNNEGATLLRSFSEAGIAMTGTSRFVAAVLGGSQS
jgi:anti-anti-sigma regulatory factor